MRVKGDPLPKFEIEAAITALVNAVIPTESFPFTRREALREILRQSVENVK